MTRQAAFVFLTSSGMFWMGSPFTRKKGMLSASSLGIMSFSPRSMKPNCLAPATRYSGTCKASGVTGCLQSLAFRLFPAPDTVMVKDGGTPHRSQQGFQRRGLTRLNATATGELVFEAISAACRRAQLSCTL